MNTLEQLHSNWSETIKPEVITEYGKDDEPALSESWNDYTDAECKDGNINGLQYHYCPAWDDAMPDDDIDHILDGMGFIFVAKRVDSRPDAGDWDSDARHWTYSIERNGKEVTGPWNPISQGSAHTQAPTLRDVLECLICAGEQDFEDFCAEFGYDEDSRKAYRTWEACRKTHQDLSGILSDSEASDLSELFSNL